MTTQRSPMKGVTCREQNGVTYWYAQLNGQKQYCGRGSKGKKIAIAARGKELATAYENREVHAGLKVKKPELKTITALIKWYMGQPSIQKLKSIRQKKTRAKHLKTYFGKRGVNEIDGDDQELYREWRIGKGIKDSTIDNEIAMLSAMYHLAVKRKKIPADFMPGEFVKKKFYLPRPRITESEYSAILKHADPNFKDVLICGYETAMRKSEIINLTRDQVHLDIQHISGEVLDYIDLGIFDTKNGARRTVPVSAELKAVLKRQIKGLSGEDLIFPYNGRRYTKSRVGGFMQDACDKARVPYGDGTLNGKGERIGIVFHCLRHTRTSMWVEAGFSDEIVRRATGHKSLAAYQQYVKLDPKAVMRLTHNKTKRDKNGTKIAQTR